MLFDGIRDHKAGVIFPSVARSKAEDGIADCGVCMEKSFVDSLDETDGGQAFPRRPGVLLSKESKPRSDTRRVDSRTQAAEAVDKENLKDGLVRICH